MIYLSAQHSGPDVAQALVDDPEELIFMLEELARHQHLFTKDITDHIAGTTAENVTVFLRKLADEIENRD